MAGGKWYEALKQSVPSTPTTPEAAAPVAAAPIATAVKPPTIKPTVVPTASTPVPAPAKKRKQQFEELPEGGFAAVLRGPEEVEEPTPAPIVAPVKSPLTEPLDAYKAGVLPPPSPVAKEGEAVSNPQYARANELYKRRKEIESTIGLPPEKAIEYLTTELVDQKAPELRLGQYTDPASRASNLVEAKEFLRQQEVYRKKMDSTAARMPYWNEAQQIADSLMMQGQPAARKLTLDFYERFTDYQMKQSGADQLRLKNEDEYQAQRRLAQQNARRAIEWLQASGMPFATSDITPVTVQSIKEAKAKEGTLGAIAETARVLLPRRTVTTSGQVVRAQSLPSYFFDKTFNVLTTGADLVPALTGVDPANITSAKGPGNIVARVAGNIAMGVVNDKRTGDEIAQDVLDTIQYGRTPSMRYAENPEIQAAMQSENPEVWVPAWAGFIVRMGGEIVTPGAEGLVFSGIGKTVTGTKDFYQFGKKSINDITAIKTSNIAKDKQFAAIKDAITLNAQEHLPKLAPKLGVPVEEVRSRIVAERINHLADQGDVRGAFDAANNMTGEYKTKYADTLMANFSDLEGGDNLLNEAKIHDSRGMVQLTEPDRIERVASELEGKIAEKGDKLKQGNALVEETGGKLKKLDTDIRAYTDAGNRPPDTMLVERKRLTDALGEQVAARNKVRSEFESASQARESLDKVDEMLRAAHLKTSETLREAAGGPARTVAPIPPLKPQPKDIEKAVKDALGTLVSDATAGRLQNVDDLKKLLSTLKREDTDALTLKYINDVLEVARKREPSVEALLRQLDERGVTDPIERMRVMLRMDPERELKRAATAAKQMTDADIARLKAEEAAAELLAKTDATKDVAEKLKPLNAQMRQKMGKRLAIQQAIAKAEAAKGATTAKEIGAAVADEVVGAPKVESVDDAARIAEGEVAAAPEAPASPAMAETGAANSMGDADVADAQAQSNDLTQALDTRQARVRMGLSPYPVVAKQQVQRFGSLPRSYSRGLSNEPFLRPDLVFTNAGRIPASELPPSAADHLLKLANNRAYNNIWSYAMGADTTALDIQKSYIDAAKSLQMDYIAKALEDHAAAADRAERAAKQFTTRVGVPYVPKRMTQAQFRDGMKGYFDSLEKMRDPAKPRARGMNEYYRSLLQRSNPDKTIAADAIQFNDFVVVHSPEAAEKAGPLSRYVQYVDDSSGLEVSKTGVVKTVGPDFVGRVVGERVVEDGRVKLLIEPHEFLHGDARYTKAAVEPVEVDPDVLGYYERGRTNDLFVGRGVAAKETPLGRKFGINTQSPRPLLEEEWAEINKAHKDSKALGKVKYNQASGMSKLDNYFEALGPPDRPTMEAFTISADDLAALPEHIREPVKRALSKPEFFLEEGTEAAAKVEAPRVAAPVEAKPVAVPEPVAATLPKELAGAKPRFNIGKASYEPQFESDIDKALYIVAQTKQSARHEDYLQFLRDATKMTDDEIAVAAGKVRTELKTILKGKPEGAIDIPTIWKMETPKATVEEIAKAKPVQQLRIPEGEVPEPPKGDAELDLLRGEEKRLTDDIEALKAESEALRAEAAGRATAGGIADLEKKLAELNDRAQKAGARLAEAQATAADAQSVADSATGLREVLEESFAKVRSDKADVLGQVRAEEIGKELRFRQAVAERERLAAMQPGERLANLKEELAGISKAQTMEYRQTADNWFGTISRGTRGVDRFFGMLGTDVIDATEELLSADYREINRQMETMAKEADHDINLKLTEDLKALGGRGDQDTSLVNVLSLTEERGYGDTWRMASGSGSVLQGTMDRVAAAYIDYESIDKIAKGNLDILSEVVRTHKGTMPELSDKLYAATKELSGVKLVRRGVGDVIFTQNVTRQAAVSDAFMRLYGLGGILGPEDAAAVREFLAGNKLSDRGRSIALTYMKKLVSENVLITKGEDFRQYIDPRTQRFFAEVGLAARNPEAALDSVDKMFKTDVYIPAPIRRKMSDIMTAPQNFTRRDWQSGVISLWKQGTLFGSGFGPARAEFFTDNLFQTMDAIAVQQGIAQGARAVAANSLKTLMMSRLGPAGTSFVDAVRFIAGNKAMRPGQTSREAMEQIARFEEILAGGHIGTDTTAVLNAEDTVIDGFGGLTGRDLWRIGTKRGVGEGVGTDLLVKQLDDALHTGPAGRLSDLVGEGLGRSASYIEQRKRFGLFLTRTQMLVDEAKVTDAASIRVLADQAAREVTEAMLNYEVALHPFERSFFMQLWLPFFAFEKSNTARVAKQLTDDSKVTAFAARMGKLYRGKTAVVQGWSRWADPTDEYGFDIDSMKVDDEGRPEGQKVYPKYVAATEALRSAGVTPGFVRYQWADTKNGAEFDALAEFSTYYAAPPPGLVVPDYGQQKFSAVWNAGRLGSLDAFQGAMNEKSTVSRSTHATFTTLWADGNVDAFTRPIALAEFLGLVGMKMAGTVDPQIGSKMLEAAGRVASSPLQTQVGGAIADVLSAPIPDKATSFTQPLKLSETAGAALEKVGAPVVKVSNGQYVNDEGTLEMENGYYLSGTSNAVVTLLPLVLGRAGAGLPRAVFAAKEWSAFDDKFIDQLSGNPNNPKQGRKLALDYMVGLRSGDIDIRKAEEALDRKYLGELTKPFTGGAAAGTVENVTAFGQQAASTTRAPQKTDKEITEAVVVATSGKDPALAGDTSLRAFLIKQGGDAEAIKAMDTKQVYDAVANLPVARKAAREYAATQFAGYDATATKTLIEMARRNAKLSTWAPESIATMRFALSTPMPGNDYARYTPKQVDQMTADQVRKELMK
jgi:hypothetical protein